MRIIITGLEMPTERENFNLTIKYNGLAFDTESGMQVAEAHELPPHGRLIDADALCRTLRTLSENEYTPEVFANWIDTYTDTIIPADLAEEGE